jgi:F-type H+-transporting ATPase subunit gamma
MAQAKELKSRIASIGSTAKITKAMQMVSASKMQKAQDKAKRAIPYAMGIYRIASRFAGVTDYQSVYLKKCDEVKNVAVVVVGTNRGFVGGLLTNLTGTVHKFAEELKAGNPKVNIIGVSIHKTALKILNNAGIKSDFHFQEKLENFTTTDLGAIFSVITENFSNGKYDEVYLVYSHFVNTMSQKPFIKKILPISWEGLVEESKEDQKAEQEKLTTQAGGQAGRQARAGQASGQAVAGQSAGHVNTNPFIFEPSMEEVLDRLLPEYFQTQIYTGILEGLASEHSARMISMQNATDNALDLQKNLNIKYNRQRQAGITQELIEVISGSLK